MSVPKSLLSFLWDVIRVIVIGKIEKEVDRADKKVKGKINKIEDIENVETSQSERTDLERESATRSSADIGGNIDKSGSADTRTIINAGTEESGKIGES